MIICWVKGFISWRDGTYDEKLFLKFVDDSQQVLACLLIEKQPLLFK